MGFQSAILPLFGFSTTFRRDPLGRKGEKMTVEYYPKETTASNDFAGTYDFTGAGGNAEGREIVVDKRKYQPLMLTSEEFNRYGFSPEMLGFQKGRKLGLDVVADILADFTTANFAGELIIGLPAAFDSDDVVDIKQECDDVDMPVEGRSLILGSAYDNALLKDANIKQAYSYGDDMPIKEGVIRRLSGFDVTGDNNIPANAENMVGFAAYKSAMLVGFAPITPAAAVAQELAAYEVAEDPQTGLILERRLWGNPDTDQHREVLECNYGKEVGEDDAAIRLVSAA